MQHRIRALVLCGHPELTLPDEPVPVVEEIDPDRTVGYATLERGADGHVYAEMLLPTAEPHDVLVGIKDGGLREISIGGRGTP